MAMDFNPFGWNQRPVYLSVTGVITQMQIRRMYTDDYSRG